MNKFIDELINAGVQLSYEGLHRSSKGARVHFSGKNRTVTDGPFAETKELSQKILHPASPKKIFSRKKEFALNWQPRRQRNSPESLRAAANGRFAFP